MGFEITLGNGDEIESKHSRSFDILHLPILRKRQRGPRGQAKHFSPFDRFNLNLNTRY